MCVSFLFFPVTGLGICCRQHWLPVWGGGGELCPPPIFLLPRTVQCVLGIVVVQQKLWVCVQMERNILSAYSHRVNRNMEVYTWMMSDSPASPPFLPSQWVFPHSAGSSWVFLQADAGHLCRHSSTSSSHSHGARSKTKAITLPKVELRHSSCASAELPAKGGVAGDGLEYVGMRKSPLGGGEAPSASLSHSQFAHFLHKHTFLLPAPL